MKQIKKLKNKVKFRANMSAGLNAFRNKSFILILGLIAICLTSIGLSYALFTVINRSEEQVIRAGTLVINVPSFADESLRLTGPFEPLANPPAEGYSFTIFNEGTLNSGYVIKLFVEADNQVNGSNFRWSINNGPVGNLNNISPTNGIELHTGNINANQLNTYTLRVWLADTNHDASVAEGNRIRLRLVIENIVY